MPSSNNIFHRHLFIAFVFLLSLNVSFAQAQTDTDVKNAVENFFKAKQTGDTSALNDIVLEEAMFTTVTNENRRNELMDKTQFIKAASLMATNLPGATEKIYNYNIRTDQDLAVVSTEFSFYLDGKLTHCGMHALTLSRKSKKWRVVSVIETRHKDLCEDNAEQDVNRVMDQWHLAAARANATVFFGSMAENGIYLGTDATERWTRDEMKVWAAKYFERGSAWDFKPIERKVYFSSDRQTAWFNETLNTWMGVCRGSGTLVKKSGEWKIEQYHLAITVPNEQIDGFIKLVNAPGRKK